ncbi:glycosyltransferase [Bradyrhizobium sp.]|uniref:glycosyltransferase family protein n=1 Tax=Bradyrhizobium sp. TaxID=376 RepID=UPI002615B10C|nr:glycosyltransferase [Bradyrhizobium sp.]
MRVLILNTDYEAFLEDLYAQNPGLAQASYAEQMVARNESLFGSANFYSEGLTANGAEAADLHLNNRNMQLRWAAEHGLTVPEADPAEPNTVAARVRRLLGTRKKLAPELAAMPVWMRTVMIAQIEHFRPDVILNQAMHLVSARSLRSLVGKQCLMAGQIAAPWHQPDDDRNYDLIVTSLPNFLRQFEKRGVRTFYNRLGFAPNVLDRLPTAERSLGVTFVGTLSSFHADRIRLLEYLATRTRFNIWGMIADEISPASPIHACYRGQAWGKEMFSIFRRSQIVINQHIGIAGEFANNMRLYEATGCGAALVTDRKTNLQELFEVGSEVVDYGDPAECVARIEELLDDPDRCAEISKRGQARTCTSHTYRQRTAELKAKFAEMLN